ncbi:MAG: hypothetical protein ACK5MG_07480 [Bacteroidales bacterium]
MKSLIKMQNVSYLALAQGFEGNASFESDLRRIQRFFAEFIFDPLIFAKLIF